MLRSYFIFLLLTILQTANCQQTIVYYGPKWHDKERTIHYHPEGSDFVTMNGTFRFNRALYGTNTAFRVEAGDLPEFAMYMPGMGGNFKLGIAYGNKSKWLIRADSIKAIYRPGSMIYDIKDSLLGKGVLHLSVLALANAEGMIVKAHFSGVTNKIVLYWAFGGANGKKFSRDGDIGADPESSFYLQPDYCKDNAYSVHRNSFSLQYGTGKVLTEEERYEINHSPSSDSSTKSKSNWKLLSGTIPPAATIQIGDAQQQNSPVELYASAASATPVATAKLIVANDDYYFLVQNDKTSPGYDKLAQIFTAAEAARRKLAERVKVKTPDPYINTFGGALSVAADAIWESPSYLHGAVAWRTRLDGWRGAYVADPLGWHDRARSHFSSYALSQVLSPDTGSVVFDTALHLARQAEKMGTSLFSSGYISRNPGGDIRPHHYDMNLVFIDQLLDHFNWTGDTSYVKQMWPLIKRHLAWEKRNFDADNDGLYDAYACIWASDALQYSGGSVTHSSAYNYRANKTAAELAALIGEDPKPYQIEADLIHSAINSQLWLPEKGWYAEYKDKLGIGLTHPAAGLWTIYHAIDSNVPDDFQAWQSLDYLDNEMPGMIVQAKGLDVPGLYELSTTNWQPYTWSINNVALAENLHTALAYWQGNRRERACQLWKSALTESMYLGASPGNFEQISYYDAFRGELYRDFADPIGIAARTLVEGLFGIHPDLLHDTLLVKPGLPASWQYASLQVPDISFDFKRDAVKDHYLIKSNFSKAVALRFQCIALKDGDPIILVNGKPASWTVLGDAVGEPMIEITTPKAKQFSIDIIWKGLPIERVTSYGTYVPGDTITINTKNILIPTLYDPQQVFKYLGIGGHQFLAPVQETYGYKEAFLRFQQGEFSWWYPIGFMVIKPVEIYTDEDQKEKEIKIFLINNAKALQGVFIVNSKDSIQWHSGSNSGPDLIIPASKLVPGTNTIRFSWNDHSVESKVLNWNVEAGKDSFEEIKLDNFFNDKVTNIFNQQYLSPRPTHPTLQLPAQGIGNWCYPLVTANIDDNGLCKLAGTKNEITLPQGIPFATPGDAAAKNIIFTSRWDNYPSFKDIPIAGHASHIYLLMAGSTNPMQSRIVNGIVKVQYTDGSSDILNLSNPENWWPIEQDYYRDGDAFTTGAGFPLRLYLKNGSFGRGLSHYSTIKGFTNMAIDGGAATVLDLPLQPDKELKLLTVETYANDVVIGLMAATLVR